MSASNGGVIVDWPQAMPPDSPAMELEVVGPSSPSVTPCPAAAARADADIDHGGGTAEFEGMSDQQLQDRINLWKGPEQSILRRMPDGGEKMQARIHRMKEELERRRARKWKDDSVLRQAKAKHTGGSRADISNFSNMKWNIAKNKASPSPKIKKDVVLLDDDDDVEPARSTDVQISNKWDESKIHYPSSTDPEAVELTYSDMKCLEPEQYLKSPVINFFLQYLKKSRHRTDLYMFNTYFYSKLEEALSTPGDQDSKFNKLRRWWRSVDIFKKAYIILPIHESMHWSLIIVCMPTKEADSGPMMLHLDSLGLHPSQKLFDIVTRYIQAEWRHLQKDSYDVPFLGRTWKRLPKNINGKNVEVPRQRNDYDCGLFMLYYIDRFIQEAPERLTKEGLGMFGRRWFKHEEASALREKLRAIMFDLFHSALDDDGPSELELDPGEDKDILMA